MKTKKLPQRGDTVFVWDEASGDFVNGVVNATGSQSGASGFIVVAPGHSSGYAVFVPDAGYGKNWAWPSDIQVEHSQEVTPEYHAAVEQAVRDLLRP